MILDYRKASCCAAKVANLLEYESSEKLLSASLIRDALIFSELSIHFLDKKFCIQYTLKEGSLEGESWSQLVSRAGKRALLEWVVKKGELG
jgi:hypothetical protein